MPAPPPPAATSLAFADAARRLAAECRARGLEVPGFRSPPGRQGAVRTLRRRADGGVIVAVTVRGRPLAEVLADMVEGVVAANGLAGQAASEARAGLHSAVELGEPACAA
ncbi:MAG: hypothetical protein AB1673_07325 [Actinomycetota bacterium]